MSRKLLLPVLLSLYAGYSFGQTIKSEQVLDARDFPDSLTVRVHPSYARGGNIHHWFFGKNYRAEWAMPVKLPVIRISEIAGGLRPVREGGGMQSKSLRLANAAGQEWVIRSVEKTPDKLLPENLRGTFALDWLDDAMSGQHPFSALIVPPLAEAAGVRHANPLIGVVAQDPALGEFNAKFSGMVVLLEEREPGGKSDNTPKMEQQLQKDNDNHYDGRSFLQARLLDLLIGDWDRHEDQWRWLDVEQDKGKVYQGVPRDRDQVFHVNQGLFPNIAALPWIDPLLGDFNGSLRDARYMLYKTRFMKAYPDSQLSEEEYMEIVHAFVRAETDEVLEAGLRRLPAAAYALRHQELLRKLKERRDGIPAAMKDYYHFINRIVDIRLSDKNELVKVSGSGSADLRVAVYKTDKEGEVKAELMNQRYRGERTREIRIYTSAGNDRVVIDQAPSSIKLRIIGGPGQKTYEVGQSARKVHLYAARDSIRVLDATGRFKLHLSPDTANTRFVPANRYNVGMPLATAAINADDGFLLGLGFRYIRKDGFRKIPYSSMQQVMITHSFATDAFRIKYNGEWMQAAGDADIVLQAYVQAPDNTLNFFGRGNETPLVKGHDYRRYYRTRFDTYQLDPALRWHFGANMTLNAGPSFQFYHLNADDNNGRLIREPALIHSYDSTTVTSDRAHAGLLVSLLSNHRNNDILPSSGYYFSLVLQAYTGLNSHSKSFVQLRPEFTFYQRLNSAGTIVLSDRVGGGLTAGKTAFYQSMFLGGQGNLLGYLQNRFAGQHMLYNNFQARVKLLSIASYILPGQLGLSGFYDAGRVWEQTEHSDQWHQGAGAGIYFSPAGLTIIQLLAGHSAEGWYPYFSMNFRI